MTHTENGSGCECRRGLSRRGFLTTMGAGAAIVAAAGTIHSEGPVEPESMEAGDVHRLALRINGRNHRLLVEPRWTLLAVLRDKLGLMGTKMGCDRGECGACTVLIDGIPRYACMILAVELTGHEITTVEGLLDGENLGPVQTAFLEEDAFQCGYCTPGQIMAAEGFLRKNREPSLDDIREGMSGNLCRCGAYPHIFKAVARAADLKRGK